MFEDVPQRLVDAIRASVNPLARDRYFWAAALVTTEYLRKLVVGPAAKPSPGFLEGDVNSIPYSVRVTLLGETIFVLRHCAGFAELCNRLRHRDLRSAFYELLAARLFHAEGFEIFAQPEVGRRGENFDFTAFKVGVSVAVEVTTFTGPFLPKAVASKLRKKQRQLPATSPSVLFCIYPGDWITGDRTFDFMSLSLAFFRGSQRINAVVFLGENLQAQPNGGYSLTFPKYVVPNPKCRYPTEVIQFLYEDTSRTKELLRILNSANRIDELVEHWRGGEFYQWVDRILGNEKV